MNQALAPSLEERNDEESREHYDQFQVASYADRTIPTSIKWLKDPTSGR